jgi:hypothetical protein
LGFTIYKQLAPLLETVMKGITEMVRDNKKIHFQYYVEGVLWYKTECGFLFPVPVNDLGLAVSMNEDKAIVYMRWIRKHLEMLSKAKKDQGVATQ